MRVWIICVAMLSFAGATAAQAGPETFRDAGDKVVGHPNLTYLDLVRQAVPGLAEAADGKSVEGHLPAGLRHLAGKTYADDPPDPADLGGIEELRFRSGGRPRIALLADFGHTDDSVDDFSLLIVFDDAGAAPRLLDAAFVSLDKDTAFSEHPLIPLGRNDDLIVTYSEHFNSNQTYSGRMLIFLHGRRLTMVEQLGELSDRYCGYERDETPAYATRPVAGSRFPEIDVTETEQLTRSDEDCGDDKLPRPYRRRYRDVFRWDAGRGRFVQRVNGVQRLDKLNEARF